MAQFCRPVAARGHASNLFDKMSLGPIITSTTSSLTIVAININDVLFIIIELKLLLVHF